MKIKFIKDLDEEELSKYKESELYKEVHSNYIFCGIHIAYYEEYWQHKWTNLSLVAFDKDDYYICMNMFSDGHELSFFGSPIEVFAMDNSPVKVLARAYQELFAKIESFKESNGVSIIKFSNNQHFVFKYYSTPGFKENVSYHSYIDLSKTEDEIYMNVRKSYKSLINWGKRSMTFELYDHTNITKEIMEVFEDFHISTSGRRTRSHESWILQYQAVKENMGYVVFGKLNGELVTAILVLGGMRECFYGVCVNRRDLMAQKLPIGHATLLKCIYTAKEKGYKIFNVGNVTDRIDPKANDIVKYQRGFNTILDAKITFEAQL